MISGIYFLAGLVSLFLGAKLLVDSSSQLASRFGVPAIFIGITVVAFSTSAPEAAVSIDAVLNGRASLAVGNVIGSNIANILLILGLTAVITPVAIKKRIYKLDIPIMILSAVIVYVLGLDGALQPADGIALLLLFLGFMGFQILQAQKNKKFKELAEEEPQKPVTKQVIFLISGLSLLVFGAHFLVVGSIEFARYFGISELIIGLTIVAVGTSLPEIATSVLAAWKKEADLSVGNVIGSNIFNVLLVLGLATVFSSGGLPISTAALALDFPFMVAVSIACLPVFLTDHKISRWEGGLFLGYYVAYLLYLFLDSTQHQLLPIFNNVMILFVIPITLGTLIILVFKSSKNKRGTADE